MITLTITQTIIEMTQPTSVLFTGQSADDPLSTCVDTDTRTLNQCTVETEWNLFGPSRVTTASISLQLIRNM